VWPCFYATLQQDSRPLSLPHPSRLLPALLDLPRLLQLLVPGPLLLDLCKLRLLRLLAQGPLRLLALPATSG